MREPERKTFGEYPPVLLKYFPKKEYADQFLAGSIRLGSLHYYANIEDAARQDSGEGKGAFVAAAKSVITVHFDEDGEAVGQSEAPGDIHHHIDLGNPTYIVCCTDPEDADIDALKNKFGPFVVRINDPMLLGQALTDHFTGLEKPHPLANGIVECARVAYDKGGRRDAEPNNEEMFRAAFTQKPPNYADENEVRLVVMCRQPLKKEEVAETITVDIGALDYAELLD